MEGRGMVLTLMSLALVVFRVVEYVEGAVTLPPEELTRHFYKKTNTCANVAEFVRHQVYIYWKEDKSLTPKLLRLVYSDCMVTGCDGSILLDGPESEKTAKQNIGLGGFVFVDKVKEVLEQRCPGVVSCADILHLATRDAVHLAGGPSYIVETGRRDGFSSMASFVDLPSPDISWEQGLDYFKKKGLDVQDLATLLGAHSTGKARCRYLRNRLYNFKGTGKPDRSIDSSKLQELTAQCPNPQGEHEGLVYLTGEGYKFTNNYYTNILNHKGVLEIDQQLYNGEDTLALTQEFADSKTGFQDFKKSFALSISRMGAYKALTGKDGEIRKNCHFTNANNPN